MKSQSFYTIVPGAALQFMNFKIDLDPVVTGKNPLGKTKKPFHVRRDERGSNKTVLVPLEQVPSEKGGEDFYQNRINKTVHNPHYQVEYGTAFRVFERQWLPFPFFAHQGQNPDQSPVYSYGPTDWARIWLTPPEDPRRNVWTLTMVIDPQVEVPKGGSDLSQDTSVYHALSPRDVEGSSAFSLAWHERDNAWFLDDLEWVKKALKDSWENHKRKHPKDKLSSITDFFESYAYDSDGQTILTEYLALYETLLEGLALSGGMGNPMRVINPGAETPVDTTLVIDVGNSRITGVIVETSPQGGTKLTDCYLLEVRDLTEPSKVYCEPLSTSVEFMEPWFGPNQEWSFARDSRGHKQSFRWPSTVRVGKEAARLSAAAKEEMGPTGMSSPKRYLWDTRPSQVQWYFNNSLDYHHRGVEQPAVNNGAFVLNINSSGVPLTVFRDPRAEDREDLYPRDNLPVHIRQYLNRDDTIGAFRSLYSRSSLMMFLIAELVAQALSCVNSPTVRDSRNNPNRARRLKNIILTVPTAMPLSEQNIYKTWAKLAVEVVWISMGWWKDFYENQANADDFRASPAVRCDWYESTCTQMIFLYNELHKKFHNNGTELFKLLGKKRVFGGEGNAPAGDDGNGGVPEPRPRATPEQLKTLTEPVDTLRVASIDIGGGTTTMSIVTYKTHTPNMATPLIIPYQDFRDGFNVAGDDIMREIINTEFIRSLKEAAEANGIPDADNLFKRLFTDTVSMGNQDGVRQKKQLRSQFVTHVAVPVALRILQLYENTDLTSDNAEFAISLAEAAGLDRDKTGTGFRKILEYVETPVREAGWRDFSLADFVFKVNMREVDRNVGFVIGQILVDMGEIIKYYDCDVLILTGRPSRWPAIMRAPYERTFLPVDRIIHIHKYKVDSEYPFVNHSRIEDPKTSVVVGAIICSLAEGALNGITIDTSNFLPQPINRYLGRLDAKGKLDNSEMNVWFKNLDVQRGKEFERERTIDFTANTAVGFRQLSCDRWTTTRLYSLEFGSNKAQQNAVGKLPYKVTLRLAMKEADDPDETSRKTRQSKILTRTEGNLEVDQVSDKNDNQLAKGAVTVRLQTLRNDLGYWLDTGELSQI
ncbi:MAG: virulence factor SrfB [Deltaproteobacteria bacterium]|jgi:hypothetical protein|nr:virulence factor SrfB [Deltaproteobacteria bacterium]